MKWIKKGKICNHESFDLSWYRKNSMVPLPYLLGDRLRIFLTMCDSDNIGRIGFIDVDPDDPKRILDYSKRPIIDIGDDGCFDDNGVVTASLLKDGENLYMFYSGYQKCVKVPYLIFTGVAVSTDNGLSFNKLSKRVPMLDRIEGESGTRCVPYVIKEGDLYRMWYTADSDNGWIDGPGNKKLPLYDLKHLTSSNPTNWPRENGTVAVGFKDKDEHGIAKCTLWKDNSVYKIIYSIRSLSKGYRLGYAESHDGLDFTRMDESIGINVSESGWDSEMIAFAERVEVKGRTYLFYCGNGYGMAGIGYAELADR